uniref:Uncharacterized protein n=1 Tax=Fagus sylvatica TaxID=28930 RepID=A0A2N9FH55_FAGSY
MTRLDLYLSRIGGLGVYRWSSRSVQGSVRRLDGGIGATVGSVLLCNRCSGWLGTGWAREKASRGEKESREEAFVKGSAQYMNALLLFRDPINRETWMTVDSSLRVNWLDFMRTTTSTQPPIPLYFPSSSGCYHPSYVTPNTEPYQENSGAQQRQDGHEGHSHRNRVLQDRFQHSGETISRHFNDVLLALAKLSTDLIKPHTPLTEIPIHIRDKPKYYPYFKDCVGAIDGTHISAWVPSQLQIPYRGRKSMCTQNVMAVCDFDMRFTFVNAGWEGTAHDSKILLHCVRNRALNFPHAPRGKYYVVDAGYPNMVGFLSPYKETRYHIPDFQRGGRAVGKEEMYNHDENHTEDEDEAATTHDDVSGVDNREIRIMHQEREKIANMIWNDR